MNHRRRRSGPWLAAMVFVLCGFAVAALCGSTAFAAPVYDPFAGFSTEPVPGGSLDASTIPKYVQPLVIPPVMPKSTIAGETPAADYNIATRQFKQQILPGGIWKTLPGNLIPADVDFAPTPIWSYGSADVPKDLNYIAPMPVAGGNSFNYPAFTIEADSNMGNSVRWINDLTDEAGNFLPHLLPGTVDQNLHWANPPKDCVSGAVKTDCKGRSAEPYTGPVPQVVHVHGAHVNPNSDGYPEAWWLPKFNLTAETADYATTGSIYTEQLPPGTSNNIDGSAFYYYENDQPATTLWYHDHSLGMTRLNVYAGPAGFYLIRGGIYDSGFDKQTKLPAVLPGPAPVAGEDPNFTGDRGKIREVPIVIQDRSFNADGTLFYPDNRAFFEGMNVAGTAGTSVEQFPDTPELQIPFEPSGSDIAPIWNPEAFFNTMVVNGTTWPQYDVAPARYRLRLLNGSNSRFINLSMHIVNEDGSYGAEIPFYQIGGDQGFLKRPIHIMTGSATELKGNGKMPKRLKPLPDPMQALLMAPAERMDVIVDFSALSANTTIRILNTAPDAPFGGFPDVAAHPGSSGQVMQFVVNQTALASDAMTTDPLFLKLAAEKKIGGKIARKRKLTLNEEESTTLCVEVNALGDLVEASGSTPPACHGGGVPMAPKAALLGTLGKFKDPLTKVKSLVSTALLWSAPITENPQVGDTEEWEIYNVTADSHPIHLHLVRFNIRSREDLVIDPLTQAPTFVKSGVKTKPLPNELGYKDTVIAYPGQVTKIKATFDKEGLYVWHCHIVEHEDNEMMRPYYVGPIANSPVR